ncbi:MAG: hypothetical protein K1X94_22660 [Sandaracinaceae bacterium]|nr:hypothetical protein [Sandaracinaceae bacterium]
MKRRAERPGWISSVLLVGALVLATLASAPRAEAGACAMPGLVLEVVPTREHTIPSDQGVLVRVGTDPRRSLGNAGDPYASAMPQLEARLEREGLDAIPLRFEELGPSTARLVPSAPPAAGVWTVVSGAARQEVTFGGAPAQARAPVLPRVLSVSRRAMPLGGLHQPASTSEIVARVRGRVPRGVEGVVAFATTAAGATPILAQSRAMLASGLTTHASELLLWAEGGRCGVHLPGQRPPEAGAEVTLRAYDVDGRLGPPSRAVIVRGP